MVEVFGVSIRSMSMNTESCHDAIMTLHPFVHGLIIQCPLIFQLWKCPNLFTYVTSQSHFPASLANACQIRMWFNGSSEQIIRKSKIGPNGEIKEERFSNPTPPDWQPRNPNNPSALPSMWQTRLNNGFRVGNLLRYSITIRFLGNFIRPVLTAAPFPL